MNRRAILFLGLAGLVVSLFLYLTWLKAGSTGQKSLTSQSAVEQSAPRSHHSSKATPLLAGTATGNLNTPPAAGAPTNHVLQLTNRLALRLSNTSASMRDLQRSPTAILLENALIDTKEKTGLAIPNNLRAHGDPGTYIVQAKGPTDNAFRTALQNAGATIVSYIPNNAYLVRASATAAAQLSSGGEVEDVEPYEPYYKLKPSLLQRAVYGESVPANSWVNILLFADASDDTQRKLNDFGLKVVARDESPFGPVVTVQVPAANPSTTQSGQLDPGDFLTTVAGLAGVQEMEWAARRRPANDLSRVTVGVASDTLAPTNYLNLTGTNVVVNVNDSGVDGTQPDLFPRVNSPDTNALKDPNGHGTHVAGIIASSGAHSTTPVNVGSFASGSISNASFRGIAPAAKIYSLRVDIFTGPFQQGALYFPSDSDLQQIPAKTNIFISNNSWNYVGPDAQSYDLHAASYDAAVRDALPFVTGSQPLLFVFPSGNAGDGNDDGTGGNPDTIESPATAKNVITVGAIEQVRNVTNQVAKCSTAYGLTSCLTNQPWLLMTDGGDEVASFSGRGNVGVNIEGQYGRFKPDVVAPGTFVVSTKSQQWDTNAYYNPTSHIYGVYPDIVVDTNSLFTSELFVPSDAVQLNISVYPNTNSPIPFPDTPIYVRQAAPPTNPPPIFDIVETNSISLPPDHALNPVGVGWYYALGNNTTQAVDLDLLTDIVVTNDLGNYLQVLAGMNDALGPDYRYESGTSMAAADVSGVLALMQEFFQRLGRTNSPALMKALLINGARSVGPLYDLNPQGAVNFQGWGLINLPTTIPGALTNQTVGTNAVFIQDQSPTNALATGDSRTYKVSLSLAARNQPLRVTLVWTDPPGNPVAGVKLVNDLDLVVTNLDNTNLIYFGNDIPSGHEGSNQPWDTNSPPNLDTVNNVENVFLSPDFGENSVLATNYSITVVGRRVNVNAVTAHTNNVVQDYALVISCGDGVVTNGIGFNPAAPIVSVTKPLVTAITNMFQPGLGDVGGILLNQHVGANTPLLGTNTVRLAGTTNGVLTLGMTNQWHFYVFTNNTSFTNAAFLTFLPPTLSLPRMGVFAASDANSTKPEADIDLYVAPPDIPNNYALTNLDPGVISATIKSLSRGGTETIVISNAVPGVYYIGVKSEDQNAAEYGLAGVISEFPFSQSDSDGNLHLRGFPVPAPIPDGSPVAPGVAVMFGITATPITVHRAIVTNTITHQFAGDLVGTLSHNRFYTVLNNHTCALDPVSGDCYPTYQYIYDDSSENNVGGARHTDGPGTLQDFAGGDSSGQWMLTMVDNALNHVGTNLDLEIFLEKENPLTGGIVATIEPGACREDFIYVPQEATNLTVMVRALSGSGPITVQVCPANESPSACVGTQLNGAPSSATLTIDKTSSPPLHGGNYLVRICNNGATRATVLIRATLLLDVAAVAPIAYTSVGPTRILDDAVTNATIFVPDDRKIASVEVGLAVDHPRVSDMTFTLVSPNGTRVLLFENRGGTTTNGIGGLTLVTNVFPTMDAGDANASTNVLHTGANSGTLLVDYNFYSVPDTLHVYYDNQLIFDSGLISNTGRFTIPFGPGFSSDITLIMNEGNNPNPETQWTYTATVVNPIAGYLVFTEDTNLAQIPIKFAPPPFSTTNVTTNFTLSGFEGATPGEYLPGSIVDGWTVLSNEVSVVNDPTLAQSGNKFLALASGRISRVLPTKVGYQYGIIYESRGPGIVSFWRGEGDGTDSMGIGSAAPYGPVGFAPGEVGQAFSFGGSSGGFNVPDVPQLALSNSLTIEGWIYVPSPPSVPGMVLFRGDTRPGFDPFYLDVEPSGTKGSLNFIIENPANVNAAISAPPPLGAWTHVAATLEDYSGNMKLYTNGVLAAQTTTPLRPLGPLIPGDAPGLGIGNHSSQPGPFNYPFRGQVDELSVYSRAISASEANAIHALGAAGKFDASSALPAALAKIAVTVPETGANTVYGNNTTWQTNSVSFTAAENGTSLEIDGLEPGMLLDSFTVYEKGSGLYYLPEQSLDTFVGQNAYGTWTLEMRDTRAGATNGTPQVVSWQLRFRYEDDVPQAQILSHAVTQSNNVASTSMAYFSVNVPTWAKYATNLLVGASAQADMYFNQGALPTGTNVGDMKLMSAVTSGSLTLSTTGAPPLVPGSQYYLGVANRGAQSSEISLQVDFDVTSLTSGIPFSVTRSETLPRYFSFNSSPGDTAVSFQLFNLSGDLNLVARKGTPLPTSGDFDFGSFNPGNKDEEILLFTNSEPVLLTPGLWYLGVLNGAATSGTYSLLATEYTNAFPQIVTLANGLPCAATSAAGTGAADYYRYTVSSNAVRAQFEIDGASEPMTLIARRGLPLPTSANADYSVTSQYGSDDIVVIYDHSAPVPLTPGDWFLSAVNESGLATSYSIMATEFPVYGTNIVITNCSACSSNFCMSWNSLIGIRYVVQGKTAAGDTNWTDISPTITAMDVLSSYCVPLPSPYHFFRIFEGQSHFVALQSIRLTQIQYGAEGVQLGWTAPPDSQVKVQWTPSLSLPAWNTFTNVITNTAGAGSFFDDGTQSGGLDATRYYRLQQLP